MGRGAGEGDGAGTFQSALRQRASEPVVSAASLSSFERSRCSVRRDRSGQSGGSMVQPGHGTAGRRERAPSRVA